MFDGTTAKLPAWKQNFLCLAKLHGLFGNFTEGVDVPVADETMPIAALQEAFPQENIQKHFIAWNVLSRAIACNGDHRDTLRHASSPAAGWRALVDAYSASTLRAKVQGLQSLTSRRVKPGANPIPVFAAMIENIRNMRANGSDIEDEVVCPLFLRALPDEYNVFQQMLEREREKLTIDRLRTELRARYDLLKEGKSSLSDTAFLASGTKRGNSGRRREKGGNVSGNKQNNGGATRKDSNGQGSTSGAGGSNGAPSGKQGGPTRCNVCNETGHKWFKCPKRICSVCRETGHDPNSCPQVEKEDANLAISDGGRLSTGDELDGICEYLPSQYVLDAFLSVSGGKLFDPGLGIWDEIGCEVGELESWISADGALRRMTLSHHLMTNYRECSGIVRTAGGNILPIEVLETFSSAFRLTQEHLTFSC